MQAQLSLFSYSLSELFAKVSKSGKISFIEYCKLMANLQEGVLNEEDYRSVRRLLHAVRRGWVEVVACVATTENQFF
ncbi:MAG TPA: hypothetical protein V6D28_01180 [Leptolyngbyaceae cyanobacterium]